VDEKTNEFKKFGFKQEIFDGIVNAGFSIPSPIQEKAIPLIMQGRDIIGQAHTGTGKTAAFGLPALNTIGNSGVELLVITPTRELAMQVSDELYKLGKYAHIKTATIYGGQSYRRQIHFVEQGVQVIVATPGRLLDMLKSDKLPNFNPTTVVLDEADEMLDMGFHDDIMEIFDYLPKNRQTLLFSATMDKNIKELSRRILVNPEIISVTNSQTTNKDIEQHYYVIDEHEREDAIIRLIDSEDPAKAIIFCRMKKEADMLSTTLTSKGISAKALHGDLEQNQREEVIKAFRSGAICMLVATDVAARGLDVSDITHVFNYHIPFDPESYVHRIGRTGRAGKKGVAITLVTPHEYKSLQKISQLVKSDIEHRYIPGLDEVKNAQTKKLAEKIRQIHVNAQATDILDILKEEFDSDTIMNKVISLLIEDKNVAGPDKIGVAKKDLFAILDRLKDRDDKRRGHGGGNSRNRSGYHHRKSSDGQNRDRNHRNDRNSNQRGDKQGQRSFSRGK
jgi:ATP-dependent RNA helicase DeaD